MQLSNKMKLTYITLKIGGSLIFFSVVGILLEVLLMVSGLPNIIDIGFMNIYYAPFIASVLLVIFNKKIKVKLKAYVVKLFTPNY